MLRVALEGRSLPVVHVGAGWDSGEWGSQRARMAASVTSRYALGAEGGDAARPGAYMCSPRNCARCPGGEWGCRRRRTLRAAREARCKACFELLPRAREEQVGVVVAAMAAAATGAGVMAAAATAAAATAMAAAAMAMAAAATAAAVAEATVKAVAATVKAAAATVKAVAATAEVGEACG